MQSPVSHQFLVAKSHEKTSAAGCVTIALHNDWPHSFPMIIKEGVIALNRVLEILQGELHGRIFGGLCVLHSMFRNLFNHLDSHGCEPTRSTFRLQQESHSACLFSQADFFSTSSLFIPRVPKATLTSCLSGASGGRISSGLALAPARAKQKTWPPNLTASSERKKLTKP